MMKKARIMMEGVREEGACLCSMLEFWHLVLKTKLSHYRALNMDVGLGTYCQDS
jgi:hypothetical protein